MDILEKARLAGLHIVVWFNARGVFLTVHTESADDTEEIMLVDAKWFPSEKEMKSFARQNFPDWQRAQQSVHWIVGESAPLQALSTPEHSATSQNLSTPTQRG